MGVLKNTTYSKQSKKSCEGWMPDIEHSRLQSWRPYYMTMQLVEAQCSRSTGYWHDHAPMEIGNLSMHAGTMPS